jgi:hypothetical protein
VPGARLEDHLLNPMEEARRHQKTKKRYFFLFKGYGTLSFCFFLLMMQSKVTAAKCICAAKNKDALKLK